MNAGRNPFTRRNLLIEISPIQPNETERLVLLHRILYHPDLVGSAWTINASHSSFAEKLAKDEMQVLIGRQDGQDVGYAWFQGNRGEFRLKEIGLLPAARSSESFAALIQAGLDWLGGKGANGCRYSGLERDSDLATALRSCGFKLEEEHILMGADLSHYPEAGGLKTRSFAEIGDPGWLMSLIQECLECLQVYDRQDMLDVIKRHDDLSFVAYEGERAVGFLMGEVRLGKEKVFYVVEIGVHPAFRRQGYATRMLEEGFGRARRRGITTAHLHVVSGNLAGIKLYQKMGFGEVERTGWWVKR